ncbi:DMT family transporter [Sphingomonas sp. GlSt437]|uniref:DMT family transporter n=2 Tax=Sphingomonas sp. GlSt437 TaxID=3389970 RepID=UPI003EBA1E24
MSAQPRISPTTAFGAACLGISIYSLMDAVMKGLSIQSGAYAAVLWRSIIGAAGMGAIFFARGGRWPGPAALRLHIARAGVAGISVLLFFWGLARVPMAESVALTFLAPLIALYLAGLFLGEKLQRAVVGGSILACIGVAVLALGEFSIHASTDHVLGAIALLAASVSYAGSLILLRMQAQLAAPLEVAFFTSLVLGAMLLPGAPWFAGLPAPGQLPAIVAAAIFGSISAMLLAWAYAHAEAQLLSTVEYTAFVWAAILGWLVFGEAVGVYTFAGAALIIAGCLVAVRGPVAPAPQTEAAA